MSLHDDDFKIPKLNTENYHTWAIRTKAALIHKNSWTAIDPGLSTPMTNGERKLNEKALAFLFIVVDDNHLNDISECQTAQDAWETLECIHTKFGLLHILQLTRELFNVTLKKEETISEYLSRITQLHQKLKKCDYGLDDKRVALIMLLGLPKSYEALILHLEQREETLNTKQVKSSLLIEEKRQLRRSEIKITDKDEAKALHTREDKMPKWKTEETKTRADTQARRREYIPRSYDNKQREPQIRRVKCFCCGENGHIAKNCPNVEETPRRPQHRAKVITEQKGHRSMKVSNIREQCDREGTWLLDSGATDHMTCDVTKFTSFQTVDSTVETANKEKLKVKGKGQVTITTLEKYGGLNIDINDVLYVPELDGNLLSVGKMEENGKQITFLNGKATIKDDDGSDLAVADRVNRLYEIRTMKHQINVCKNSEEELWHKRLGHLLLKTDSIANCDTCIRGKIKRKKFPKVTKSRATQVLELIHSDVVGPVTPISKGGSKWLITFIDDHSRFIKVYFMKHKNEALKMFKIYQKEVERQLERKVKALRTDNGREYCNQEFQDYLEEQGITRQLTVPNSPQQNGVAERANQTLMDITRCLLIESGVPQAFWADALDTAAYLKNKFPSQTTDGIPPEEVWTGKRVQTKHLKVYGCQAWSAVRAPRRTKKLQEKGEECILIGYPEGTKGYKLWNRESGRISVNRDIIFREDVFPCLNPIAEPKESELEETVQIDFGRNFSENPEKEETQDPGTDEDNDDKALTTIKQEETPKMTPDDNQEEADDPDPKTLEEAIASKDAKRWKDAMQDELDSLEENLTWKLVPRPKGETILGSKWIFKKKYNASGELEKYKARLVARGFEQKYGINYTEVFAPVVKQKSLRLLLAIATERRWLMKQIDIKTAYLNGHLEETIYMERPKQQAPFKEDLVCLLQRSLYGLKQAGRQWNIRLDTFLKEWGMRQSQADPGIYHHPKRKIILGVYVDDLLIITDTESTYNNFFHDIDKEFGAKNLGDVNDLLSIKIQRMSNGEVHLNQKKYIEETLEKYGMQDVKGASTPLAQGTKLKKNEATANNHLPYRQAMGSLLYISGSTRPDIAHATSYLSQFSESPSKEHWNAVKHLCRYLQQTKDMTLSYRPTKGKLQIYADADWGNDLNDRKSYSGYVTTLASGAISWGSRKQRCVALSTVEAEYLALCEAGKEAAWLRNLMEEIKATEFLDQPISIHTDNQGAISLAQNKITSERNKHIDLKYFQIRNQIEDKNIDLKYIKSENNPADILTKITGAYQVNQHRPKLGLNQESQCIKRKY